MNFEYPAFLSFAHLDNQPVNPLAPKSSCWISNFHTALEIQLSQLMGGEKKVWMDKHNLSGNEPLNTILENLQKTALLISVLSPSYIESNWCMDELNHFCKEASKTGGLQIDGSKHRLFKVIKISIPLDKHPPQLKSLPGYKFFDSDGSRVRTFNPIYGQEWEKRFFIKIDDLAQEMSSTLTLVGFGAEQPQRDVAPQSQSEFHSQDIDRKVIYLAETTEELEEFRNRIRRELVQAGHEVLPVQELPQGDTCAFTQAIEQSLDRAHLSIHLLSPNFSQTQYTQEQIWQQLRIIRTHDQVNLVNKFCQEKQEFSRLLWVPPNQDIPETDKFLVELQNDSGFIRKSLEEFKDIILDELNALKVPESETPFNAKAKSYSEKRQLYLDCIEDDLILENPLFEWIDKHFQVIWPDFNSSINSETRSNQCDVVLVYYNQGTPFWLTRRLLMLKKGIYARPKSLLAKAVYATKVPDPDALSCHPNLNVIEAYQGFQQKLLEDLLASLDLPEKNT